ncbi:DUF3080 family protein [Rhodocyclaceae bacterium SMB388]
MEEYVKRLGRVLEVDSSLSTVPVAPEFPRMRERVREIAHVNASMLDFLGLYGCELQQVVGERNSTLGRVMHPTARLDYELRFIRAAEECIPELDRDGLKQRLVEVIAIKREILGDIAWNAVWGSREIEAVFTRSRGAMPVRRDPNAVSQAASDLQFLDATLQRALAGELNVDVDGLDPVYQRWHRQPVAGQLIQSAILLTTRLEDASSLLEARLGETPLCEKPIRTRRADTMHSMFLSVFAGEVQPYLSEVQQARFALIPTIESLAALGGEMRSASFDAYAKEVLSQQGETGLWHGFDRAVARHTKAWQALLEQCGMRPGMG